jgi:hypothetical protein
MSDSKPHPSLTMHSILTHIQKIQNLLVAHERNLSFLQTELEAVASTIRVQGPTLESAPSASLSLSSEQPRERSNHNQESIPSVVCTVSIEDQTQGTFYKYGLASSIPCVRCCVGFGIVQDLCLSCWRKAAAQSPDAIWTMHLGPLIPPASQPPTPETAVT